MNACQFQPKCKAHLSSDCWKSFRRHSFRCNYFVRFKQLVYNTMKVGSMNLQSATCSNSMNLIKYVNITYKLQWSERIVIKLTKSNKASALPFF